MKPLWRWTGWLVLALGLLVLVGIGVVAANLVDFARSPDLTIMVDDETIHLAGLSGGAGLLALGGVLLAVLVVVVVVVVVPLALLFGLGVPLLLCVGGVVGLLLVAGAALLALASPFIALALVIAWLVRPRRPRPPRSASGAPPAQHLQPDLPSEA